MADEIVYSGAGLITKSKRNDDGTVTFEASKAAGPDLDGDQQILDGDWLDKAMAEWFATGGNVREMHQNFAAGKALTLEQRGGGDNWVSGIVVDPGSAAKLEHKVLTGLSVGIKWPRVVKDAGAPGGRIVDGRIVEVSLVDRPCNPTCKLQLAKADDAGNAVFEQELLVDKADLPDIAKADTPEVNAARQALAPLVQALSKEIDDLAAGDLGEQFDISRLTDAISSISAFLAHEVAEQPDAAGTPLFLSDQPDAAKADQSTAEEAPDMTEDQTRELFKTMLAEAVDDLRKAATAEVTKTDEPDEGKAETPDLALLVQNAVTKAVEPLQTGLAEVTSKVNSLPADGGPVVTRTAAQAVKSDQADLKAEYLRKSQDPTIAQVLRDGYAAAAGQLG